jgi:ABC-type iron transport system FetAB permease component
MTSAPTVNKRVSTSEASIPGELWVLLLGGGAVITAFTYLFGTRDLLIHAAAVALTAALMGFVMYLIFALEHPFVGALSVAPAITRTCSKSGRITSTRTRPSLRNLADSDVAELNDIAVTLKTDEAGPDQIRRQVCLVYHPLAVQRHTDAILVHSDFERVPVPL